MAKTKKYYVIWQGHETGIFSDWATCQKHIKNYPGAKYKSFPTKQQAEEAWHSNFYDYIGKKTAAKKTPPPLDKIPEIIAESWSVDAACSGNPGLMEYRGVDTRTGTEIFKQGPYKNGTNNIGEFLAIVHALALLKRKGDSTTPIYTDSKTAMAWIRNKKAKTLLKKSPANALLFDLIQRAEDWLKSNDFANPIIKWKTESWGEIPADFGRK